MRKIAFETPLNNPKNENKKNGKLMEQNVHYVIKRAGFPWVWQRYLLIVEGGAEPLRCPPLPLLLSLSPLIPLFSFCFPFSLASPLFAVHATLSRRGVGSDAPEMDINHLPWVYSHTVEVRFHPRPCLPPPTGGGDINGIRYLIIL